MTDADLLLKAIHENPDEDTVRLAWADELESTDPARAELVRLQLDTADPKAHVPRIVALLVDNDRRWRTTSKCVPCNGIGWYAGYGLGVGCPSCSRLEKIQGSGDAGGLTDVRQANANTAETWLQYVPGDLPLRVWVNRVDYVRGTKVVHCRLEEILDLGPGKCRTCSGTGIIMIDTPYDSLEWDTGAVQVERGCPACGGSDAADGSGAAFYQEPTSWARRVIAHHPDVTEFRIIDREPYVRNSGAADCWWATGASYGVAGIIPYQISTAMKVARHRSGNYVVFLTYFTSSAAAHTSLGRALVAYVRAESSNTEGV